MIVAGFFLLPLCPLGATHCALCPLGGPPCALLPAPLGPAPVPSCLPPWGLPPWAHSLFPPCPLGYPLMGGGGGVRLPGEGVSSLGPRMAPVLWWLLCGGALGPEGRSWTEEELCNVTC